jgi:hypothetical protein
LRYVGAPFANELPVNTYGLETDRAWNQALVEQLPDFKWQGQPEQVRLQGNKMFAGLFSSISMSKLMTGRNTYSQYLLDQFS